MNKAELMLQELMNELTPEELEPRLELQIVIDPMSMIVYSDTNNINGGNNIIGTTPTKPAK